MKDDVMSVKDFRVQPPYIIFYRIGQCGQGVIVGSKKGAEDNFNMFPGKGIFYNQVVYDKPIIIPVCESKA